ncbi:biopolymer transporter ExbD [Oscillatoria sp. FACHB-1406]|uniref:ExbD/TolR family protein n=1 Tax=Oscillatoria sp. FACHB-1406 TaxID=2692846 RepID=UPI0016857EDE|nr:biopolymer transporter ExbD [Oscillatoria sp. FACHB-1406]MBD2579796.1 biopolymer transporter ExbD [Oscillatoria sp. FACHB-1406]
MRLPEEEETPLTINIVPMIDVIFAILTFFMVSSLFLTRSQGFEVNLPGALTAVRQDEIEVTVSVNANGAIAANRQPATLATLETLVRQQLGTQPNPLIVLKADTRVNHGQVVAVMDRLRRIEGAKLAIAVED